MIHSFGNELAKDLFDDKQTKATRRFPGELRRAARRKLAYLHDAAELNDLKVPPANRLEKLKGNYSGFFSVRINDQWRVIFKWIDGNASEVSIVDYH